MFHRLYAKGTPHEFSLRLIYGLGFTVLVEKRVCELFAGVGGFRLGLERAGGWQTVWSSQWEPGKRIQHASSCYVGHFGPDGHSNEDIGTVDKSSIPDHDLLVGGFPCQDYSVATTQAKGLEGKKGVLWWQIYETLKAKRPRYALLENVDRLLKSPTTQRGRDFGIILWCLNDLGYTVEWRVVNAGEYGFPQKRRRVFIFAARSTTKQPHRLVDFGDKYRWLQRDGFFASELPVLAFTEGQLDGASEPDVRIEGAIEEVSNEFEATFLNAGVMVGGEVWTLKVKANPPSSANRMALGDVLENEAPEAYYLRAEDIDAWTYLKGAKREARKAKSGFEYKYSEGPLPFPDSLDRPARTILTNEGGPSPSRFKHVVLDPRTGRLRRLTPVEVERINGFDDNWTGMLPDGWRYFTMGNALVVGLIERMGRRLGEIIDHDAKTSVPIPAGSSSRRGRVR